MSYQRKAAVRAFSGLAGSPLARIAPAPTIVVSPVETSRPIFEAKKKPGPSRKYEYTNEAERKRVQRAATRLQIEMLLNNFGLESDTPIPADIKKKCNVGATTYGTLLKDEKVQDRVLKLVLQILKVEDKMLHGFPEDGLNNDPESSKILMRDAPSRHGLAISLGGSTEVDETYGAQTEASRQLSGPNGYANVGAGDRRKAATAGNPDKLEAVDVKVNENDDELTFIQKIRWPKKWFREKFKRPYNEIANECASQVARLLCIEEQDRLGYSPENGHSAETVYYCRLCEQRQGVWPTPHHFVTCHQNAVIKLFRTAGVLFKKAFFNWEK
jgi:hypothetical protein